MLLQDEFSKTTPPKINTNIIIFKKKSYSSKRKRLSSCLQHVKDFPSSFAKVNTIRNETHNPYFHTKRKNVYPRASPCTNRNIFLFHQTINQNRRKVQTLNPYISRQ